MTEIRRTSPMAGGQRRTRLAMVAGINAVAAWAGVVGLATGRLSLGADIDRRLPFDSLALAGAALGVIVAVPLTVLALYAWDGDGHTDETMLGTGVLLVAWIGLQVAILREPSWFQPFYACFASGVVVAATRPHHRHESHRECPRTRGRGPSAVVARPPGEDGGGMEGHAQIDASPQCWRSATVCSSGWACGTPPGAAPAAR
jgi:hypothetical protein